MDIIEAIVLGIIQGMTEFLPVSSSGHLEIGKYIFGVDADSSFAFSVAVHGATVLSTIVVFRHEIIKLLKGATQFRYNDETRYILKILVSLIPVMIVGFAFKEKVEGYFDGNISFVGFMLIVTAMLLIFSSIMRKANREINYLDAFVIGIAQAFAVLPGISRSGATISTGLALGNSPAGMARFSFLMVLIPVIGANLVELLDGGFGAGGEISVVEIITGFVAAFISGYIACRWMIKLVQKGRLYWFGIYCLILGIIVIVFA